MAETIIVRGTRPSQSGTVWIGNEGGINVWRVPEDIEGDAENPTLNDPTIKDKAVLTEKDVQVLSDKYETFLREYHDVANTNPTAAQLQQAADMLNSQTAQLLSIAGVPVDENSLNAVNGLTDEYGTISTRWELAEETDAASDSGGSTASTGNVGGMEDQIEAVFGPTLENTTVLAAGAEVTNQQAAAAAAAEAAADAAAADLLGGDADLTGEIDTTSSTVDGGTGNIVQEGVDSTIDTTGWVRTSELGAAVMTYKNDTTGETFEINMNDVTSLPPQEQAAIKEVNTRTTNTAAANNTTSNTTDNNLIDISIGGLINGALNTGTLGPIQFPNNTAVPAADGGGKVPDGGGTDGTDGTDGIGGLDGLDGADGADGRDGGDGGDGKDGTDGKDGLSLVGMLSSPIANEIFKTEFKDDYLRPQYVDRILRGRS